MKSVAATVIISIILVSSTGCTRYHVKRSDGTELSVLSSREFPNGIKVKYQGENGTGLEIDAGSVQSSSSLDSIIASAVAELLLKKSEDSAKAD